MNNTSYDRMYIYLFEITALITIPVAVTAMITGDNWVQGALIFFQWPVVALAPLGLCALCGFHCRDVRRLPSRFWAIAYALGVILVLSAVSLSYILLSTILESRGLAEYTREELARPYWWVKVPVLATFLIPVFVVLLYRAIRGPWAVSTADDEIAAKLGEACEKLIPDWSKRLSTRVNRLVLDGNTKQAVQLYREERGVSWDEARIVVERWKHCPWKPALSELSSYVREASPSAT